jgi:hypothetical protein
MHCAWSTDWWHVNCLQFPILLLQSIDEVDETRMKIYHDVISLLEGANMLQWRTYCSNGS